MFIVSRAFWCWYFKFDRMVELLEIVAHNTKLTAEARNLPIQKGID